MTDKDLAWEELHTEHIVQDQWIDFRKTTYRYPDGRIFEPFYTYSRKDYSIIVATDTDGNYICVRQFRQGIQEVTTEFPAGGLERKDGREYGDRESEEEALDAAKRELKEETGYVSDEWEHLLTIPSNATIADNYAYVFTAKNCRPEGAQDLDETEIMDVVIRTPQEVADMVYSGRFKQATHVMAWLLEKETRR